MEFKEPQVGEKGPIKLSPEEKSLLTNGSVDDPRVLTLMQEKGIEFDQGDITIDVDGEKMMVSTEKHDFFTRLMSTTIEEKYDDKKLDSIES